MNVLDMYTNHQIEIEDMTDKQYKQMMKQLYKKYRRAGNKKRFREFVVMIETLIFNGKYPDYIRKPKVE